MNLPKIIKRNPVSTAFMVGIIGCFALSSPNISRNMQAIGQVRDFAQQNTAAEMRLRASLQSDEALKEIAETRYQQGCVMVVASSDPQSFTTLSVGQPVIDQVRKTPLPVGTIVCDANGNTGKIVLGTNNQPVIGEVAFTGNRKIVEAARQRANARYSLPNQ